jgi:hypothetical protein
MEEIVQVAPPVPGAPRFGSFQLPVRSEQSCPLFEVEEEVGAVGVDAGGSGPGEPSSVNVATEKFAVAGHARLPKVPCGGEKV